VAAELRYVLGGATSIAGSNGQPALLRNIDKANLLEGLAVAPTRLEVFPLDDGGGPLQTSGCDYGSGALQTSDVADENAFIPHIAEGIDVEARNEILCTSQGSTNILGANTAVVHAMPLLAADARLFHDRGAAVVWSPRSNVDLYGNTAPVTLLDAEA